MSFLLNAIAFLGLFAVGVATIPLYIHIMGAPLGGSLLGKGMFILGQLAHGGTMIRYDGEGNVELLPFDKQNGAVYDPDSHAWHMLEGEETTTYRFGWAPVAIDTNAEKAAPASTKVPAEQRPAAADGGTMLLDETRGGVPLFSDVAPDQPAIHYLRYLEMHGRDGNRMISRAEENALEEFGGEGQKSQTFLMMLLIGAFVGMFGLTFAMLLVM